VTTSLPAPVSQHVDVPVLLASFGAAVPGLGLGAGAPSTMNAVSSVFSSETGGASSAAAGGSGQSYLPFMYDSCGAGEPIVYTASAEGDWILDAGFEGDGWFVV